MLKRIIIGRFVAIVVLLEGCEKEEKVVVDLVESEIVEDVHQVDETVVDDYWSQPIDSEHCQTVGECRDLGDIYGSGYFTDLSGTLKWRNNRSFLNVATEENESVLDATDWKDEDLIIARYEIIEDEFVLTRGEEESVFRDLADIVLALFDRNKVNMQFLDFREDIYPRADVYEKTLLMPSNLISHWLQSDMVSILIHEYGHMLTWNAMDYVISDTCPADQYYLKPSEECYNADSYMTLYYQAFLNEYEGEWLQVGYKNLDKRIAFYEKHKDSFVSTYATVHPLEDIAESFSHFMLTPYNESPQTVPEKKVNFFYQFPGLVEYRAFVLKELKNRKDETWAFY